jgi:hypothetical protein
MVSRSQRSKMPFFPTTQESEVASCNPNNRSALGTREGKSMPWNPKEAERHTKKANDPKRQRMWADIANSVLSETGDEGRAIREANSVVARDFAKSFPGRSGK